LEYLERVIMTAASVEQVQTHAALLRAALQTHAHLEDCLLFSHLESHLDLAGPLRVLRAEHEDIEHTLDHMPQVQTLAQAQALVQHLLQVVREHFAKEEQVLFPLAEQMLDAETSTRLGGQWAESRGVALSPQPW
jgi:regulator of cell morphogenesis and NO signaling